MLNFVKRSANVCCALMVVAGGWSGSAWAEDKPVDFAREILPILSDKCFVCHGPDAKKDELRLDSLEAATVDLGGYQALNPKTPSESELIFRIFDKTDPMPPEKAEKKLTDEERALLKKWVMQGGKYSKHWAFVAPKKSEVPKVGDDSISEVDRYVLEKIKAKGAEFAPEAEKTTLARRAALVLTGLPPSLELLDSFMNDSSEKAYEKYVDKLLAQDSYGEHQARYWLDAVRYGDTHGLHLDNKRGIYPYRDWVVSAFNRNLPMDDFITYQLAGDLLPNPTLEQIVATGFVRMNPTTSEGGVIAAEFQAKNNFDRTESIGTVLLGMTLNCARCHTHKYDPILHEEYFGLFAFFNSTAESPLDGNKYEYGPTVKAPQHYDAWEQWYAMQKEEASLLHKAEEHVKQKGDEGLKKRWAEADKEARIAMLLNPREPFAITPLHQGVIKLQNDMKAAEKGYTTTLVAKELPKPRKTFLLKRGEYNLPSGEPIEPDVLGVMNPLPEGAPRNRLGFAKWVTSRENPVVSRVWVNRVWQRVFGEGLVRTPEDFGLQGQQPTHPELLDWLAVEFQESGWDLKHLLRVMVTSRTFKQSSAWRKDLKDPENKLFARGPAHRLAAETLRDIALVSSDMLDPTMGGEGVKPYQPSGMWAAMSHPASNTKKYVRDKGERLYRKSLYVYYKRTSPHPMMTIFDAPSRESSCVRRSRTSTPSQSLGLLNETQRVELARKCAERLIKEAKTDEARLDLLFRLVASRKANEVEAKVCMQLLAGMKQRYETSQEDAMGLLTTGEAKRDENLDAGEVAAWTQVVITVLASDAAILLY